MWAIEAEELKDESYGVELLQTVGFVYASKSRYVPSPLAVESHSDGIHSQALPRFDWTDTIRTRRMVPLRSVDCSHPQRDRIDRSIRFVPPFHQRVNSDRL